MCVLSVYRRKGGGYVLSPEPMSAKQAQDYNEPLVGIGVVGSEKLEVSLAANIAQQLAQGAYARVSAEAFDTVVSRGA